MRSSSSDELPQLHGRKLSATRIISVKKLLFLNLLNYSSLIKLLENNEDKKRTSSKATNSLKE